MLSPEERSFLKQHLTIDGDGNIVGNDNTVQITKVRADTYVVHKDQQQVTITVQDLRRVFNIEHSQIGVVGDNATIYGGVHFYTEPPANPRERRNRAAMLQRVHNTWIEGVLEQSLHGAAMLELGKAYDPQAVERPWDRELFLPGQERQPVPHGTSILEIFERCSGALLILGEPGSGKTTTLLELARALIAHAEDNPTAHIPVVFNLSSWDTKQTSFEEWLLEELHTKYQTPKKVAQVWLENDTMLPLLDGLDEVRAGGRELCVTAINAFRQEHFVPLAVCSRTNDYKALTAKLHLGGAIYLRPLSPAQIDAYLAGAGTELQTVRELFHHDSTLRQTVRSPLMLSIITLAHSGLNTGNFGDFETVNEHRQHILDVYIQQMFKRRTKDQPFTRRQTLRWLTWLARQMLEHQQSLFLARNLPLDGLTAREYRQTKWLAKLAASLTIGLSGMLGSGLISGLTSGRLLGDKVIIWGGIRDKTFAELDVKKGLLVGLISGFIVGLDSWRDDIFLHYPLRFVLTRAGHLPWRLALFLDYCVDRIFLRRVGGGYIFVHRLLQEHFASLTPEDIERLAANADASS